MRLLLDENGDRGAVSVLRSEGFDALQSSEACGRGATDEQVLAAAIAFERVVVTHDRDFGLLAACARPRDLRKRRGSRHDESWPRKKAHEAPGPVSVRRATAREMARHMRARGGDA